MNHRTRVAAALIGASMTCALQAQTIVAPSGRTLFRGASLVRTTFEIDRSSFNANGQFVTVTKYVPVLAVVYGFYPKWSVIAAQPYAGVQVTSRMPGMVQTQGFSGLADAHLLIQYDGLYSRNSPGGMTRLSGVFGLQVPTGSARITTGAVEYSAGLIFEKAVKLSYVFSADSEYTFSSANNRAISTGDSFRFDGAVARFIIPNEKPATIAGPWKHVYSRIFRNGTYFIFELNGQWQASGTVHGNLTENTGGTKLSVSPGIQYFVSNSFLAELSFPIPVVRNLSGIQPRPETSVVMGFRYLF